MRQSKDKFKAGADRFVKRLASFVMIVACFAFAFPRFAQVAGLPDRFWVLSVMDWIALGVLLWAAPLAIRFFFDGFRK